MSQTFFTSDTHFGHANIIKYCNRPFQEVDPNDSEKILLLKKEMDAYLIERWNSVVGPDDEVWHLGDFAYTGSLTYAAECQAALHGRIHLIEGNHDQHALAMQRGEVQNAWLRSVARFESVDRLTEVEVEGQRIILCHYALREWHHALRGVWHLYGHTHAELPPFGKSFDCGVDNAAVIAGKEFAFCPLSFEQVKAYMDLLPIGPHPQFENYFPGHPELEKKSYVEV